MILSQKSRIYKENTACSGHPKPPGVFSELALDKQTKMCLLGFSCISGVKNPGSQVFACAPGLCGSVCLVSSRPVSSDTRRFCLIICDSVRHRPMPSAAGCFRLLPSASVRTHILLRYRSALVTALAPSATAVTTWRSCLVRTSPAAKMPGTLVSQLSPALM